MQRLGKPLFFPAMFLFVGIVWSIALAFLLLETTTHRLLNWAAGISGSPQLFMPQPSPDAGAKCAAEVESTSLSQRTDDVVRSRQVRLAAWKMGFQFGFVEGLSHGGSLEESQWKEMINNLQPLSQLLSVPAPHSPQFGPAAAALSIFGQLVEDDTSCTAAYLNKLYGPRFGHLYKAGALIGHAVVYRVACPECGALFVPQIRFHGTAAGLPEARWHALTRQPVKNASSDERRQQIMALVGQVEKAINEAE